VGGAVGNGGAGSITIGSGGSIEVGTVTPVLNVTLGSPTPYIISNTPILNGSTITVPQDTPYIGMLMMV